MRKYGKILIALCLAVSMLALSAAAAGFEPLADELNALGVFTGSATGYNLDREPTRAEAAVMLVRLLGMEQQAKDAYLAAGITHPFTDVADWAAPSVAYLYENGLTNGVSAGLFGADWPCSAQMYCTFALRALGYSDAAGADFTYDNAVTFATLKGIADPFITMGTFKRAQLVAVSYQALAAQMKGGETPLLAALVEKGAVSADKAAALLEKIDTYRAYAAASQAMYADGVQAADMSGTLDMAMEMPAMGMDMAMHMLMDMQYILDGEDIEMAMKVTADIEQPETDEPAEADEADEAEAADEAALPEKLEVGMWVKDGWMYMDMMGEKTKTAFDFASILDGLGMSFEELKQVGATTGGLYMVDAITAEETAGGTLYTITYGSMFDGIFDAMAQVPGAQGASVRVGDCFVKVLIGSDGAMKSMDMEMSMGMSSETTGTLSYEITAHFDVNATGGDVVIEYPDFSGFTEAGTAPLPEPEPAAQG